MKLDVTQVFSIVDRVQAEKQQPKLPVVQVGIRWDYMVKETGTNQRELRYKWLKKLVGQITENYIEITWEKPQKSSYS